MTTDAILISDKSGKIIFESRCGKYIYTEKKLGNLLILKPRFRRMIVSTGAFKTGSNPVNKTVEALPGKDGREFTLKLHSCWEINGHLFQRVRAI
jgi:hypothetical protein